MKKLIIALVGFLILVCLFAAMDRALWNSLVIESRRGIDEITRLAKQEMLKTKIQDTWEDYFKDGIRMLRGGHHQEGIAHFSEGARISSGDEKNLCLLAAALCAMAEHNSESFNTLREELERTRSQEPGSADIEGRVFKRMEKRPKGGRKWKN
jgi:hypothetical protein